MKYIKIIILIAFASCISSCGEEFLTPDLTAAISEDDFFQNESQLELAVVAMYDGIQGVNALDDSDRTLNNAIQIEFYLAEMLTDNTRTKDGEGEPAQFEKFQVLPTNSFVFNYYRSFYNVIFRANKVLANLDVASDENRARIEAEAKFVRAYAYFNLVRLFGDLPLADRVIDISETEVQFTRVSQDIIYDLIISDFQNAIEELENGTVNRASKAAAQALLAKVYLTRGTNYIDAQLLLEQVMTSGFALEPNFKDVFYDESNSETIFAIGFIADIGQDSQGFSAEWQNAVGRTSGVNYVTDETIAAFAESGGNRGEFSFRVDPTQLNRTQVVKYLPNGDAGLGIDPTGSNPRLAGNDWIVLRYADVLLMHVEAIMAGSQQTTSSTAIGSFQAVRDRAGLTDPVTVITKEDLLKERRVELAFENHRLFDLKRFNAAQETLAAFSAANGFNFSATDVLLPLPQAEINLSGGVLTQNPGY